MTVAPLRPISAGEAALRVELAPQPGQLMKPGEVVQNVQVVTPQAGVMDNITLRKSLEPPLPGVVAAPEPATPAQAVKVAAQSAASQQGGLAPLLAELAQALKTPGLPTPLKAAAAQVLSAQTPLGPEPSARDLQVALGRSGLFLEAKIAAILAPEAGRPLPSPRAAAAAVAAQLAPGLDAKAALLAFRETLRTWLAAEGHPTASPAAAAHAVRPPSPPYAEGPMHGQPPATSGLPAGAAPQEVAQRLIHSASAALAREELLQIASLPEPQPGVPKAAEGQRWMFELPLATPHGPAIAQFEVSRDGPNPGAGADFQPVWRARFSIDVEPLGPVHAHVSLKPGRTAVTLWAERAPTAELLRDQGPALSRTLRNADMAAEVAVYAGTPRAPVAGPGQFLDQAL